MNFPIRCACVIICFSLGGRLFAHDQAVHVAITVTAAESALRNSTSFAGFVNLVNDDCPEDAATNAIAQGSYSEDNRDLDSGGKRSLNHFYDPLDQVYGKGLSDSPPDQRLVSGTNSFVWASTTNCLGYNFPGVLTLGRNEHTTNIYSWPNARGYEWLGLTSTSTNARYNYLTNMFRSVGQVLHLLQDASQPQHVRNEQHLDQFVKHVDTPWRSPIEDYGDKNVKLLNYSSGMLDWRTDGFTKLEDFWDRHLYKGNAGILVDAENSGEQLGLAEWCNGNFLGVRHLYPEYYPTKNKDISWYPYPSLNHSTDYLQKMARLSSGVQPLTFRNAQPGRLIYLTKVTDGVTYPDISRFTYFGGRFPYLGMMTINDDNVISNYHNVFIPKVVQYSAGVLDYFTRGTMSVSMNVEGGSSVYAFMITNTSSQDFLNGSFYLLGQDASGDRSMRESNSLSEIMSSNVMPSGGSGTMMYTNSAPADTLFYLVYQGTIGQTNNLALDLVDQGIAIAVAQPSVYETISYTNDVSLTSLGFTNGSTLTTNVLSPDFPFVINGSYGASINYADFDDKGTIGNVSSDGAVTSCTYAGKITNAVVSSSFVSVASDGQSLSVPVIATDDPICGDEIGWRVITITWWASPPVP